MKVKVNEFAAAIELELEEYVDDIRAGLGEVVTEVGAQCVRRLKSTSPKRSKGTKSYAKGWTKTAGKDRRHPSVTVYNRTKPGLAHLLENGHQKASGGRVEGQPHIRPAVEEAERVLAAEAEKMLREVSS